MRSTSYHNEIACNYILLIESSEWQVAEMENDKRVLGKVTLLTFGSEDYFHSMARLRREAESFQLFDRIVTATPQSLGVSFWERHGDFVRSHPRGYGYWLWKSYLTWQTLQEMKEGEILFYVDSGCVLNLGGRARFLTYLEKVRSAPSGILSLQMPHIEKHWTKRDLFERLQCNRPEITDSGQYVGGIFWLRCCERVKAVAKFWHELCQEANYHFVDDSPSELPNDSGWRENRHDQSIFSVLRKLHGSEVIEDETWFYSQWSTAGARYPIWAQRRKNE